MKTKAQGFHSEYLKYVEKMLTMAGQENAD
jgi:hypothetical protein